MKAARALPIRGVNPDLPVRANAGIIIGVRLAELLFYDRIVARADEVEALHAMRIAAKHLRYTLEIFAPYYGKPYQTAIEAVKQIQEMLGRIHDADVLLPELLNHVRSELRFSTVDQLHGRWPDLDGAAGLIGLCRDAKAERRRLHAEFVTYWKTVKDGAMFEQLWEQLQAGNHPESKASTSLSPNAVHH